MKLSDKTLSVSLQTKFCRYLDTLQNFPKLLLLSHLNVDLGFVIFSLPAQNISVMKTLPKITPLHLLLHTCVSLGVQQLSWSKWNIRIDCMLKMTCLLHQKTTQEFHLFLQAKHQLYWDEFLSRISFFLHNFEHLISYLYEVAIKFCMKKQKKILFWRLFTSLFFAIHCIG